MLFKHFFIVSFVLFCCLWSSNDYSSQIPRRIEHWSWTWIRISHKSKKNITIIFCIFIRKNRCLKTTQTCEISLNKTIKWRRSFYTHIFCYHSPSDHISVVFGNLVDQTVPRRFSWDAYLHESFSLFEQTHINKKNDLPCFPPLSSILYYCFFLYWRFLNLRGAGWGVPMVGFSWAHPEVIQTPGGPLRPAWPLSPGRPTCPLSPSLPGWPLKALPGRPCWPVIEAKMLFSLRSPQSAEMSWVRLFSQIPWTEHLQRKIISSLANNTFFLH